MIEFLDELTPIAQAIGAVNTIYPRDSQLIGDNTDAQGFLSDLTKFLDNHQLSIVNRKSPIANRKSAIVLGAGGSARAVVYALLNDGWRVTLAARRIEQAQELLDSFANYQLQITDFSSFTLYPSTLIVNTTPLGMTPDIHSSPLPANATLSSGTFVYDVVYNPRETKLVRHAKAQGCQATTGLGMLVEQAALSFEIWTGHNPPRELLYDAVSNL
jgi:shikimate dehydrogenase